MGQPPKPRRIDIESYTLEKLFEVLADNPRGVLSRHDELSGLLGGLNEADASCWAGVVGRLWGRALAEKEGRYVPYPLFFTEAARARWVALFNAHVAEMNADEFHPALGSCWGKFREYPWRFALVLALVWQADLDELRVVAPVDVDDVDRAWRPAFDTRACSYGTTGLLPGWGRCDA